MPVHSCVWLCLCIPVYACVCIAIGMASQSGVHTDVHTCKYIHSIRRRTYTGMQRHMQQTWVQYPSIYKLYEYMHMNWHTNTYTCNSHSTGHSTGHIHTYIHPWRHLCFLCVYAIYCTYIDTHTVYACFLYSRCMCIPGGVKGLIFVNSAAHELTFMIRTSMVFGYSPPCWKPSQK